MTLLIPAPWRVRGALATLVAAGLVGVSAAPATAADGLRPTVKLATTGSGSGIGDFNGDGLDDVVTDQGGAIIFGSRTPTTIDLSQPLGTRGIRLRGTGGSGSTAPFASPVGDLDHDGFDDVAARIAENPEIFIVYGAAGTADVELRAGPRVGIVTSPRAGIVDRLGDWDGDGIDDFTITRSYGNSYGGTSTNVNQGVAVIRGGARITSLNALTPGPRVQPITAAANCQLLPQFFWLRLGCAWRWQNSTPVGDFDGDGKADLWIRTIDRSWILRGRASTAAIDAIRPTDAIEVQGATPNTTGSVMTASRLGDLNGDGRSDLSVSGNGDELNRVVFGRAGTAPVTLSFPDVTLTGVAAAAAAGDVNGDGRDDVTLFTRNDRAPRYLTDLASRGAKVDAGAGTLIPGLSTQGATALGDFDGDGKDDLLAESLQLVRWGAIGGAADVFPPQLEVSVPRDSIVGRDLEVSTFLSEPAMVRFEVTDESGATALASVSREVAGGQQTLRWTPTTAGGQALPIGVYGLRAVARDAAGNQSPVARSEGFSLRAAAPATVRANVTVQLPDGLPVATPVPNAWTVFCQAPTGLTGEIAVWSNLEIPGSSTGEIVNGEPGKTCWISIQAPVNIKEFSGYSWSSAATIAGVPLAVRAGTPDTRHEFILKAGLTTIDLKVICTGGVRLGDTVPPLSNDAAAWRADGIGAQPQGTNGWRLTPASANATGLVASSKVIAPSGFRYSFTVQASGGNGAAEGVAMAFLPESAPVKAGAGGGGLGIGGTGATVVAFDLNRGPNDPGDQFIGISDSTMTGGHLNYLATAPAGHRMRGTAFKVDVVHQGGVLSVSTNGKVRLSRTIALPARARIAFSASTGATIYQEHVVSGFSMSRP